MFPLELLVLVTLPAIYVAGGAFFAWPAVSRPWLFVVLTLGAMYLLYIAVFFLLPATPQGYILEATADAKGGTEIITKSTDGRVEPSLLRSFPLANRCLFVAGNPVALVDDSPFPSVAARRSTAGATPATSERSGGLRSA